jgi:hypothetical protein
VVVVVGGLAARLRHAAVEQHRLSEEQAALRRVATLVARGALPHQVFSAVGFAGPGGGQRGRDAPAHRA